MINTAHVLYHISRMSDREFQQLFELYDIRIQKLASMLGEKQKRKGPEVDVEKKLLSSLVLAAVLIDPVRCILEDERANLGPLLRELDLTGEDFLFPLMNI